MREKYGQKRILVVGAAGYNLGDNAIAYVVAKTLKEKLPDAAIAISSLSEGALKFSGVREFHLNRSSLKAWASIIKEIHRSDVVLLGGGTLIQDALGCGWLRGMVPYIWQIAKISKAFGKRVATVPIGIDEIRSSRAKWMASQVLRMCEPLLVRDEKSVSLAKELIKDETSEPILAADPVFMIGDVQDECADDKKEYIAVSFVKEKRPLDVVVRELKRLVEGLVVRFPESDIYLVTMDYRECDELGVYRQALKQLNLPQVGLVVPKTPYKAAGIFRNAKVVIAMRLHAMTMALGYAPLVGISRATKTDNLTRDAKIYAFRVGEEYPYSDIPDLALTAIDDVERLDWQRKYASRMADLYDNAMIVLTEKLS